MNEVPKCACGCGQSIAAAKTGRPRVYASSACRLRAHRSRIVVAHLESLPDAVMSAPVGVAQTSTDEQIARAVLDARAVGFALQRLGTQARPELAWRCTKAGNAIIASLQSNFPNSER